MTRSLLSFSFMLLFLTCAFITRAQDTLSSKITKAHYTVSGGLLGAFNYSTLQLKNNNDYDSKYKAGFAGGIWFNFPVTSYASIEPQVQYSRVGGKLTNSTNSFDQQLDYISVPVLVKIHASESVAFLAGPQVSFLSGVKNLDDKEGPTSDKEHFKSTDIAVTGGIEVFPRGTVSIYGRYIYSFYTVKTDGDATFLPAYNRGIQAGVKLKLFGKFIPADSDGDGVIDEKDKCPAVAGFARYDGCPIPDTDGDGFNDEADKCPTQPGVAEYNGCPIPDKDKDGVTDDKDKCPDVPGLAKYDGCPIPDTDGDGINDEQDKCPKEAGVAKYNGCPVPDSDGDGINDEEDRCPNTPGVPEMRGCPKVESFQARQVTFATSRSVLTAGGKKELDKVVDFLQRNADVKIKLDGHTDNTGTDKINNPLSAARAASAKAYIVSRGIDASRIATEGHGSAQPVEDNKTPEGRSMNRRVEVSVQ